MTAFQEAALAVSSAPGAALLAKATAVTILGFLAVWMARRACAALRHALLTAMFGMTLILPIVSMLAPPVRIALPVARAVRAAIPSAIDAAAAPGPLSRANTNTREMHAVARPPEVSLPAVLIASWLLGSGLCLLPVLAGWWHIRCLRRSALCWREGESVAASLAREAGVRGRVDVFLHADVTGPMTCGVAHPGIVLPQDATSWDRDDLHRAIVHELEHVRRRDSVTHCLARMACACYWFHPLVWLAFRRLALEAERSCDDAVLGRSEPTAYAEQLVELAQRLATARRPAFLAMANRSDLGKRVRAVIDVRQRRGRAGALAIALAFGFALAVAAGMAPLVLVAQLQQPESSFEVASVKPSSPVRPGDRVYFGPARGGPGTNDPRRITWTYAALRNILMTAYNVQTFQIVAPDWLSTERYDIAASVAEGATREQVAAMWQNLLKERFGMVLHHESKEFQVEEVTVAKGGAKLKETDLGPNPDPFLPDLGPPKRNPVLNGYGAIVTIRPDGKAQMVAKALTMADIAARFGNSLRMPVIDKTGLAGRYDFTLDYTIDLSAIQLPPGVTAAPSPEPGPDLASAVQEQLGLKLNRAKAPLDVIVIDHIEKVPSEN